MDSRFFPLDWMREGSLFGTPKTSFPPNKPTGAPQVRHSGILVAARQMEYDVPNPKIVHMCYDSLGRFVRRRVFGCLRGEADLSGRTDFGATAGERRPADVS
ncbi:uncharacterized protein METZ01_LOCUS461438, partial [marine metagenome]